MKALPILLLALFTALFTYFTRSCCNSKSKVEAALTSTIQSELDESGIELSADHYDVTLKGVVPSEEIKTNIGKRALAALPAGTLNNMLRVEDNSVASEDERIRLQLEEEERIHLQELEAEKKAEEERNRIEEENRLALLQAEEAKKAEEARLLALQEVEETPEEVEVVEEAPVVEVVEPVVEEPVEVVVEPTPQPVEVVEEPNFTGNLANDLAEVPSIYFREGHVCVDPPDMWKFNKIVQLLKDAGNDDKIDVIGYADARGSITRNKRMAYLRAAEVRNLLISNGIKRSNINTVNGGIDGALDDPASYTSEATQEARRVEVRLVN